MPILSQLKYRGNVVDQRLDPLSSVPNSSDARASRTTFSSVTTSRCCYENPPWPPGRGLKLPALLQQRTREPTICKFIIVLGPSTAVDHRQHSRSRTAAAYIYDPCLAIRAFRHSFIHLQPPIKWTTQQQAANKATISLAQRLLSPPGDSQLVRPSFDAFPSATIQLMAPHQHPPGDSPFYSPTPQLT